jgi:putative membrane protein
MAMPPKLKEFLIRWVITTVGVLVAAHLVPGIHYDRGNWEALFVATLVLGLLNAFLRPLLLLLSLPLLVFTLGLFTLVINAGLFYLVGQLIKGFHVENFGAAFWGALVISIVSIALQLLTGTGNTRIRIRRGRRGRSGPNDGDGPIIDV